MSGLYKHTCTLLAAVKASLGLGARPRHFPLSRLLTDAGSKELKWPGSPTTRGHTAGAGPLPPAAERLPDVSPAHGAGDALAGGLELSAAA